MPSRCLAGAQQVPSWCPAGALQVPSRCLPEDAVVDFAGELLATSCTDSLLQWGGNVYAENPDGTGEQPTLDAEVTRVAVVLVGGLASGTRVRPCRGMETFQQLLSRMSANMDCLGGGGQRGHLCRGAPDGLVISPSL